MDKRPKFKRSLNRIELLITYKCNRNCYNCQAMVRQAPSNQSMSVEQIKKFIAETIVNQIKWETIRVLGGEPTLHEDVFTIFQLLNKYKHDYSPKTEITLVTNGYGEKVKTRIDFLSEKFDIEVENSNKMTDKQTHFMPVNKAPIDRKEAKSEDLTKGCWITAVCGIALDLHGYYPCSTAAAIDRVFGFDVGRKQLPSPQDSMDDLFKQFCKLCGHYYHEVNNLIDFDVVNQENYKQVETIFRKNEERIAEKTDTSEEIISSTWEEALKRWRENKPKLSEY